MFYTFEDRNTRGIYRGLRRSEAEAEAEPITDQGQQTYTKKEQSQIVKNVKNKIKRLRKQQRDMERLKNENRGNEDMVNQLKKSQMENNMSQREFQKFLKRMSKE